LIENIIINLTSRRTTNKVSGNE